MTAKHSIGRFATAIVCIVCAATARQASAQLIRAPLDTGFARTSSIVMTVDEMLGSQKARPAGQPILGPGYPALWIAEVQFKPVRYRRMEVTDPKTGQKNMELVWYMIYRVIPRDCTELAGVDGQADLIKKLSDANLLPQNDLDEVKRYSLQIPQFVLRTDDSDAQTEYNDEINLEIQRAVLLREFQRRSLNLKLANSIQAIQEVVDPVSVADPDQLSSAFYGVAVWRNVDPTTDYFTVTMKGFSNAYRMTQNAAGDTIVEHKVIEQRFGRPGDEFNQQETEFRIIDQARLNPNGDLVVATETSTSTFQTGRPSPAFVGILRQQLQEKLAAGEQPELSWPTWKYMQRPANITAPDADQILRNAKNDAEAVPAQ